MIGTLAAVAIPSIIQMVQGAIQSGKANKMSGQYPRPDMPIPQGMLDALDISKNLALTSEVPGQRLIEEKLNESAAGSLNDIKSAATSPNDILAGVQGLNQTKLEKINNLGIAGAEMQQGNQLNLAKFMEQLSVLQEKKWMRDEYMPYLAAQDAARRYNAAAGTNVSQGVSNLSGIAANVLQEPDAFGIGGNVSGVDEATGRLNDLMKNINPAFKSPGVSDNYYDNPIFKQ